MHPHIMTDWWCRISVQVQGMDRGPLVAAATGSSASTLVLWFLREFVNRSPDLPFPPLDLQCPVEELADRHFLLGLLIGLAVWPLLEFLVLGKQYLLALVRARLTAKASQSLYKVL